MIEKEFAVSTSDMKFSSLEGLPILEIGIPLPILFVQLYTVGKALMKRETPSLLSVKAVIGSVRR